MSSYTLIFENIIKLIELNFFYSLLIFSFFIFLYSTMSLPGMIVFIIFAGYVFGFKWGFFICIISATLGSFCFFLISKYILSKYFYKIYSKYTNKVDLYIKNSTLEYLIIFRVIPGPPLMLQNFLLSVLDISNYKFFFSTLIGFSPIMFFCVFLGNKINDLQTISNITSSDIFTWDLISVVFLFICILVGRIFLKNKLN